MTEMPWFKFRRSWFVFFRRIRNDDVMLLLECIEAFLSETELPEVPERLEYIWLMIQLDLEGDVKRLKKASEAHREAGKKGGRPRKTEDEGYGEEDDFPYKETKRSRKRIREDKEKNKDSDTEKEKDKESEKENPLYPPKGDETLFDRFWAAYPRKESKAIARRTFNKLRVTEEKLTVLLDALAKQKTCEQWSRDNGRYIPYASNWLNGERWKDNDPEMSPQVNPFLNMLYADQEGHA